MDATVNRTIKRIEVVKLFGYYNYNIDHSQDDDSEINPLLIIYGDNGSGKTTIMRMIFYLLSPVNKAGHKTKLSEIKFESFKITLNDGTIISAVRGNENIVGSYDLLIVEGKSRFRLALECNSEGAINLHDNPVIEEKYIVFLDKIKKLNIAVNFLSDDRKILSFSDSKAVRTLRKQRIVKSALKGLDYHSLLEDESDDSLDNAIKKLESWIRSNVLKGAKAGEENTNTIYNKLVKQISRPKNKAVTSKEIKILLEKIKRINSKSFDYYESGLVSSIEIDGFENALITANESNITLIYNIIEPYIDGIQGRLDLLSNVQNVVSKFLDSVNSYFVNKKISYKIETGFTLIHTFLNEQIDFQNLSSGEKQLLQLFCNVITASEESTIFIIDEPEISLNVKWQRKLIGTLLSFSANKNVQFIFASHSIELLSGHRKSVHKLVSI